MTTPSKIDSLLVEFHRFGESDGLIRKGERYIRATGWDKPAHEVSVDLSTKDFFRHLGKLRYVRGTPNAEIEQALQTLSGQAGKMLEGLRGSPNHLLQLDLVTSAAELWAFPFEAWMDGAPVFAARENQFVPTRRIRGEFAERPLQWPAEPKILFVHAPVSSDLPKTLVDDQVAALVDALEPWKRGRDPIDSGVLTVREVHGPRALDEARGMRPFTHIHLLAHGAQILDSTIPGLVEWGLRLGDTSSPATPPAVVAGALAPRDGLPVVVSLAACDSANEANPAGGASLAQELHLRGVPVVVASQLPLTTRGATTLTRYLYQGLLQGDDVRSALHDARARLYEAHPDTRDWMSLVAYVRLPEGYADHLEEVGLRAELAMLEAAHARAGLLSLETASAEEFAKVEARVRDRIRSLEERCARLDPSKRALREEGVGLLASAHKRLAEMMFNRAARLPEPEARARIQESRRLLGVACDYYRKSFRSNIHSHWAGAQQLSLEAILTGKISQQVDWYAALRAAELDGEERPEDFWPYASIAELQLLAPLIEQPRDLAGVREALKKLRQQVLRKSTNSQPIELTRRQFGRYVDWWTNENGFFPGRADLAQDAREVLSALD